ncbi:hypothetical protein GCM10010201_09820 [Pilimelia columellifera subsp. columellifera]|uniref:Peptidase C1A papain C-terminal domain-containing protein n=1 Tax=Pilimelia columellifera subsp. columellifera TaxID=706583 RepID=A0ABN3N6U3_9ACTN
MTLSPVLPAAQASAAAPRPVAKHKVGGYVKSPGRINAKPRVRTLNVLPASVDLRSYAPAVGNQGQIGSCVSWSIAHSIMGYWANRTGGVGAPYAPLYLYMRTVAAGGAPSAGTNPDHALSVATNSGVTTQADYFQGYYNYQTPPTAGQIANAANYRVSGYSRLWLGAGQTTAAKELMMQSLASGNPVAIGMPVYSNFMSLGAHTLYSTVSGTNQGGHMMAAYGYDSQGIFVRNSWGTGWGNSGDVKIAWSYVLGKVDAAYTVNGINTPAQATPIAPTVARLSVLKGSKLGGTQVTLTGSGMDSVTGVTFGGVPATNLTPTTTNGTTTLTVTTPPGAVGTTVDVVATNPAGSSAVTATSKFLYTPPSPELSSLSTNSTVIFGGERITMTGGQFATGVKVMVGAKYATGIVITSPTQLSFLAPAQVAGTYPVKALNTYGASAMTNLTYVNPPPPTVATVVPSTVMYYKSTPVLLTGANLTGATLVTLGGYKVAFTKVSATQLKVTVPVKNPGTYSLQVTTPGGTVTVATPITSVVPAAPTVTGLSVTSANIGAPSTVVLVNGTNLTDASKVYVGGVAVTFARVSDTQVKATLAKRYAGGYYVQVQTPGGLSPATSAGVFTYFTPAAPTVGALSVTSTSITKSSTVVYVNGANLSYATKVYVGGVAVGFTKISDTQIKATLGKRYAGNYYVQVQTPGGLSGASQAGVFRYV